MRKLSCSGVDQEGFPGLTPPPAAAENDLPIFQQNFAGYLYKGNVGKVDQQTFSAVEKTITWCKADRQVGKCAAGCKISLNGVENQSVLAGFNVNQVVQRYFWETPCEIMTGISSRTESFGSSGNINLEYKKNTFWKAYRLRRSAAVQVEAVVRRKET